MIHEQKQCKYCKNIFYNINGKVFSNHVRWCPENKTNGDKGKANIKKAITYERIIVIKKCPKCGKEFEIQRTIHNGYEHINKDEKMFCSRKCANGHQQTKEQNETRSRKLKRLKKLFYCSQCGKQLKNKNKFGLCIKCLRQKRHDDLPLLRKYRSECAFKFNVFDYPKKFDLKLIKQFGIYKASNRGNNLNGVSRDHIYSVMEGFENNIDPKIISHPANCQLLRHTDNSSKNKKSDITLDELKERIKNW